MSNWQTHLRMTIVWVYAMRVTQKFFEGLGNVSVPHRVTMRGRGRDSKLADFT